MIGSSCATEILRHLERERLVTLTPMAEMQLFDAIEKIIDAKHSAALDSALSKAVREATDRLTDRL